MAYKFKSEQVSTKLEFYYLSGRKNGCNYAGCDLDPVQLAGTIVKELLYIMQTKSKNLIYV
jgi:NAD-dependent DNA ligase